MVRTYKRKTNRGAGGNYSKDDLDNAIGALCKNEMTLSQAAKHFKVPKSTLLLKTKGWKGRKQTETRKIGGGGRPPTLPWEEEENLAKYLKTMCKWGFGLSRQEVIEVVADYVKANQLKTPFTNGKPGRDWFVAFRLRHQLTLKKPEQLENLRVKQTDPFVIYDFFDKLEIEVRNGFTDKPKSIWNLDETGVPHDPSTTKVVGGIGQTAVRQTAGPGREMTTVLAAVSADGDKLPPCIVYQGKKMWESWMSPSAYPHTSYYSAEKGYMTQKVFHSWLKYQFLPKVTQRPLLLIYDGHLSHVSVETVELAMKESVTILKLPSHTTQILQPLDTCVFKPFKTKWDETLTKWQRSHYGQRPRKSDMAFLIGEVWPSLTPSNIKSGFKTTGIFDPTMNFPVNRNAISQKKFDPNQLKRYYAQRERLAFQTSDENSSATNFDPQSVHPNSNAYPAPVNPNSKPQNPDNGSDTTTPNSPTPSTSFDSSNINIVSIQSDQNSSSLSHASTSQSASFEELLLERVKQKPTPNAVKRKQMDVAEVITREEYLSKLEEEKARKVHKVSKTEKVQKSEDKLKKVKKSCTEGKIKKHKEIISSSSDSDDPVLDDDSDDDIGPISFISSEEKISSHPVTYRQLMYKLKEVQSNIQLEMYYAVYFEQTFYIGRALRQSQEKSSVEVKFLHRAADSQYVWPTRLDQAEILLKFFFYGPLKLCGNGPFTIPELKSISACYSQIKKLKNKLGY